MTEENDAPDPTTSLLAFFGTELLRLRGERGVSQTHLAKSAFSTQSMISKIEAAQRVPSKELAHHLDVALDTGGHFSRLYPLVIKYAYPSWFLPFIELEREASTMRVFESQIVPGLLQTEEYAKAMLSAVRPDNLDDLVAARMSRQEVFERELPPRMWFVLDEQALHRPIGGAEVWRAQLEHMLKTGQEPRVVIQVVPRKVTSHPGLAGPFSVLGFEDDTPDVLYVDGFSQGRTALDAAEVAQGAHAYDLLRAVALSPEESADLLSDYMEGRK
ncbi:helix-turn-helix transcriptional regulator [Streptomyces sp. CHA1]|uniref:helix-turn-helix domain-containing protein n=1 Tax=unclassified Streptomyces TaxID=2593676 RepID=UPI001BFC58E3|nr:MULTISPECIES: helix-turn-helix transcriptional regulator [unclassified Streptomyces]MBT3157518.1 helix-turn-helix transcriptional regulator [Streptomyces sp. G11C]MCO6701353.1 helix-turn-helix transcriptional regulator [Streptomyces sp. CHB9.2]MCO6707606.1 helix-turn-helix transcriptional regulator [Streptomyces sp. CHA3]MCO6713346.1 helix-turn-helix transcriptional regulator [Streptomyces sp. CHB19.2]MCO6719676.1 helix-turn-helix transcriptional regulator [Streptomyces sp. Vc714c-19]